MARKAAMVFLVCLLVGGSALEGNQTSKKVTPFKSVVQEHFDSWDTNKDGKLESQEIDTLLRRHTIKGEAAAALASIHIWFRDHKSTMGLTKSALTQTKDGDGERRDMSQKSPHFAGDYVSFVHHLNSVPRKVFTDKKPQLESLSQGHLGDCYFVSMVGALVHRSPESVHRMIQANEAGDSAVIFADGKRTQVKELPDALICLGSTARDTGLWLNVLEEGFGQTSHSKKPGTPGDPAIDKIGHGGSQTTTIALLTGKHAINASIKKMPPAKVHQLLVEGHNRHALMGAGTEKQGKYPKGIASNHAYAVLSVQGEKIQVWNPWGNHFTPKGTPGLENGYPTEKGVFTVGLHDFCQIFGDVTIETGQPAQKGRGKR